MIYVEHWPMIVALYASYSEVSSMVRFIKSRCASIPYGTLDLFWGATFRKVPAARYVFYAGFLSADTICAGCLAPLMLGIILMVVMLFWS